MRRTLQALQAHCRQQALNTTGLLVSVREEPGACPICRGAMQVQKSLPRHGATLEHGAFEVRETVHACAAKCVYPSGLAVTRRAQALAQRLPPGCVFGYDVMVLVGLHRFLHHRQREEIREMLRSQHGIALSTGGISNLAGRFLDYLQALHHRRSEAIRAALAADGGWPLHVDATGEEGRGTLLVALAGWRRWVLGAWTIPSEKSEVILPHLRSVVLRFGAPCAVMRDLGRGMIPALADLVQELDVNIPVLACHQHFLADVGEDLLDSSHSDLRKLFRQFKVRPGLRALARDLGRRFDRSMDEARRAVLNWQQHEQHRVLPEGRDGLAVVRAMAQWVLDFPADSTYGTFPFDRPYLDLYDRCARGLRAADAFLRRPPNDRSVRRSLERFRNLLDPIVRDEHAARVAGRLRARAAIFDELRDVLRMARGRATGNQTVLVEQTSPGEARAELHDIRADLDQWVASLGVRRPQRGPAKDTREAIDVVLDHLDRHGYSLWGHVISLGDQAGAGIRVVDRTNAVLENLFGEIKHGERRRSGRKNLTHDLEQLPAAAALTRNLTRDDYVSVLCDTLDALPAAFAELDAERHQAKQYGLPAPQYRDGSVQEQVVGASLPTADRRIVRTEAMKKRLEQAARSRPPRSHEKCPMRASGNRVLTL